jgi:hypothetical protein
MILMALSICSLFDLSATFVFWFTLIFAVCGYSLVIYIKLKLALDEEECEYILKLLSKVKNTVKKAYAFLLFQKSKRVKRSVVIRRN